MWHLTASHLLLLPFRFASQLLASTLTDAVSNKSDEDARRDAIALPKEMAVMRL
jgi:hypothetical protein